MKSLIRTEWLKMRKYNAFWWIIGITALSYPGINYMFYLVFQNIVGQETQAAQYASLAIGNPFTFPTVWHTVAFFSSLLVIIPAVVIIMFISNEYTFRTHRQNIIDGWSRAQFVTSKLVDVLMVTLLITLIFTAVSLITGFSNQTRLIQHTWDQSYYIGLFFLQTFSQLSIAFLCGFLIKKAFLALGVFMFYTLIFENFLVGYLSWKKLLAADYFPMEISDKLIPRPAFMRLGDTEGYQHSLDAIQPHVFLTVGITVLIWAICYRVNARCDLK